MALQEHCFYCFDVLLQELGQKKLSDPTFENKEFPLFVTWKARDQLRGCIGTFSPVGLHCGLQDYAKKSAFQDTRFSPIQLTEIPTLHCEVSLLTNFELASDWQDWTIGQHGIRILLRKDRVYSATYLPQVAKEQGWNHHQTISSLLRKAGFKDSVTNDIKEEIQIVRYEASKAFASFQEYCT